MISNILSRYGIQTPTVIRLHAKAIALSRESLSGPEALHELMRERGYSKSTIKSVLRVLKFDVRPGGDHTRSAVWAQAIDLVEAAIQGKLPPAPSELALKEAALDREFRALPLDQAFEVLCLKVPELGVLADDIRRGSVTVIPKLPEAAERILSRHGIPKEEQQIRSGLSVSSMKSEALRQMLDPLVGPRATRVDPLINSPAAWTVAMKVLQQLAS